MVFLLTTVSSVRSGGLKKCRPYGGLYRDLGLSILGFDYSICKALWVIRELVKGLNILSTDGLVHRLSGCTAHILRTKKEKAYSRRSSNDDNNNNRSDTSIIAYIYKNKMPTKYSRACAFCHKVPAKSKCARCEATYYCSKSARSDTGRRINRGAMRRKRLELGNG